MRSSAAIVTCFSLLTLLQPAHSAKLPDWLTQPEYRADCNYTHKFFASKHISTDGNSGWKYFRILGRHFLAAANYWDGKSPNFGAQSIVYEVKEEGAKGKEELTFSSVFEVRSNGARGWEYFEMLGEHMLALTNYAGNKVMIFRYRENHPKLFENFQTLSSDGPVTTQFFEAARERFLTVGENIGKRLSVFKLVGQNKLNSKFELHQQIETEGLASVKYLVNDKHYLFTTTYHDGDYDTKSSLYVLDHQKKFQFYQSFQTTAPHDVEAFNFKGTSFAFISSERDDSYPHLDSSLYVYNEKKGKFVLHQTIPTDGAHAAKYFEAAQNSWLAVANFGDRQRKRFKAESALFKWNSKTLKFEEHQKFMTFGATNFEYFRIGRNHYLAVSNEGDVTDFSRHHRNILYRDSIIYKLKTTEYCPKTEL